MPLDMGWIQTPLDQLYGQYSGMLVADGQAILWALATLVLVCYAVKHGLTGGILWFLVHYGFIILIAANLLKYYAVPCPLLAGHSVSGFLPAVGEDYANLIGNAQMDILFGRVGTVLSAIGKQPLSWQDWSMIPVAWGTQLLLWIIEAAAFGTTALAYAMIGILRIVGPLFIPWLIVPRVSFLFWNWLQSLLQYSFYRVTAAILVFVIGTAVVNFIDQSIHQDYTLAHFSVLMAKMVVITTFSVFLALRNNQIVADLFHGASYAGSEAWTSTARAAGSAVRTVASFLK